MSMVDELIRFVLPYGAFFGGAYAAHLLNLHRDITLRSLAVMGLLSGLVVVSLMLNSVRVEVQQIYDFAVGSHNERVPLTRKIVTYGHEKSVPQYVLFCGILAIYGTSSVSLFKTLRQKYSQFPPAGGGD